MSVSMSRVFGVVLVLWATGSSVQAQCRTDKVWGTPGGAVFDFGASVAISGNRFVVGSPAAGGYSGLAYVFEWTETGWTQTATLQPAGPGGSIEFGISVAIDGDTILVGADLVDGPLSGGVGAAYVFEWDGAHWVQAQKLQASDGETGGFFGYSVALDGDTAVIGRYWDSTESKHAGSAYVFTRVGGTWGEKQKLVPTNPLEEDNFGYAVAIGGGHIAVGAPRVLGPLGTQSKFGRVFAYDLVGGLWTETAMLTASDAWPQDQLGISVAVDADHLVAGAWQETFQAAWSGEGKAVVWERRGGTWTEQQILTAVDGKLQNEFGSSVAVQGPWLLVGAASHDAYPKWGAVYSYRLGTAGWELTQLFLPDANPGLSWLGISLAMEGNHAVSGAYRESVPLYQAGDVYVFGGFDAWHDVGFALDGWAGPPELTATGTLCQAQAIDLSLQQASPSSASMLVVGGTQSGQHFKGGILVPSPDALLFFVTSPAGGLDLSAFWPGSPFAGNDVWFQFWIADAGGPQGVAASNAVVGSLP